MSLGYIKEATYQFSDLYLHGKWSNSWGRGGQTKRETLTDSQTECSFIYIDESIFPILIHLISINWWLLSQLSVNQCNLKSGKFPGIAISEQMSQNVYSCWNMHLYLSQKTNNLLKIFHSILSWRLWNLESLWIFCQQCLLGHLTHLKIKSTRLYFVIGFS